MSSWVELLNKFLDKSPIFPAGALSALTIGTLLYLGVMSDLKNEISWLWMVGIFCTWVTLCTWLYSGWSRWGWKIANSITLPFRSASLIAKLDILTQEQELYLQFLKLKGKRFFQAWDNDETIAALEAMDLIISHERTDPYYSRYEIPKAVWKKLDAANEQRIIHFRGKTPWEYKLGRPRY